MTDFNEELWEEMCQEEEIGYENELIQQAYLHSFLEDYELLGLHS